MVQLVWGKYAGRVVQKYVTRLCRTRLLAAGAFFMGKLFAASSTGMYACHPQCMRTYDVHSEFWISTCLALPYSVISYTYTYSEYSDVPCSVQYTYGVCMVGWLAVFITVLCSAVQCIEWLTKLLLIKAPLAIDTLAIDTLAVDTLAIDTLTCMHNFLPPSHLLPTSMAVQLPLANSLQASLCPGTLTSQCETPQALAS